MPRKKSEPDEIARGPHQTRFREQLIAWREAAPSDAPSGKMTQAELDKKLNKAGKAFIGQVEIGALPPPPEDVCLDIGRALRLPRPDDVWDVAAPALLERMNRSGDLVRWHERQLAKVSELNLTSSEVDLIHAVREMSDSSVWGSASEAFLDENGDGNWAAWLVGLLRMVSAPTDENPEWFGEERLPAATAFMSAVTTLAAAPFDPSAWPLENRHRVIQDFAKLVDADFYRWGYNQKIASKQELQVLGAILDALEREGRVPHLEDLRRRLDDATGRRASVSELEEVHEVLRGALANQPSAPGGRSR